MILINVIDAHSRTQVWQGFVPVMPPPGMELTLMLPAAEDGNTTVRHYQVEGASLTVLSESNYAPNPAILYVRDLQAPNIITPGMIQ